MRRPGDAGREQPDGGGVAGREDEVARHRREGAGEGGDGAGGQGGGVLLVVELQQRLGVGAVAGDERREILEQHDAVGKGVAGVVAEAERAERRRRGWRGRGPGRSSRGRGSRSCRTAKPSSAWRTRSTSTLAPAAMPSRMRRPVKAGSAGAAAGAVPLEEGAVAVAGHRDRGGHGSARCGGWRRRRGRRAKARGARSTACRRARRGRRGRGPSGAGRRRARCRRWRGRRSR